MSEMRLSAGRRGSSRGHKDGGSCASTENVHENVIPPQGAPVPSKKGGKKKFIIGGIVAVVLILIAVMIGTSGGDTGTTSTDTYIETVQNRAISVNLPI